MTVEMAMEIEEPRGGSDSCQFLTFSVQQAEYGVDLMKVQEIKAWSQVTRMPNSPKYMRGVMNLRGVVVPIFDLRARFGQGDTEAHEKNVVIILAVGERIIGILVDAVSDILSVGSDEIKSTPSKTENNIDEEFVEGLISIDDNKMVILLDAARLFDEDVLQAPEALRA